MSQSRLLSTNISSQTASPAQLLGLPWLASAAFAYDLRRCFVFEPICVWALAWSLARALFGHSLEPAGSSAGGSSSRA